MKMSARPRFPRDSKSSVAKRRSRASKVSKRRTTEFPNHLGYDQENITQTSHIPAAQRSYGLLKTSKTMTPFPKKSPLLDENFIRLRLEAEKLKRGSKTPSVDPLPQDRLSQPSEVSESIEEQESQGSTPSEEGGDNLEGEVEVETRRSSSLKPRISDTLPFELRRRLFDEAEYTIAKGKKMGETVHHEMEQMISVIQSVTPLQKVPGSYFAYFYDLEKLCRNFNIKMTKGFEF